MYVFTFWFVYVEYVFDSVGFFGPEIVGILTELRAGIVLDIIMKRCGFFNTVLAGRVRNVFFCSSS